MWSGSRFGNSLRLAIADLRPQRAKCQASHYEQQLRELWFCRFHFGGLNRRKIIAKRRVRLVCSQEQAFSPTLQFYVDPFWLQRPESFQRLTFVTSLQTSVTSKDASCFMVALSAGCVN